MEDYIKLTLSHANNTAGWFICTRFEYLMEIEAVVRP